MKKLVTLGGSNSKKSINKQLAEYTGDLTKGLDIINVDLNAYEMPMFSVDVESESAYSKAVISLNDLFDNADAFVVSLAEHNGSYSAVFKNTLDWLSRLEANVWRDKPMILLSTSPGGRGGQTVLQTAVEKFPRMGAKIVGSMSIPSFYDNFKNKELVNEELKTKLKELVVLFEKEI